MFNKAQIIVTFFLTILIFSCTNKGFKADFSDMMRLRDTLVKVYTAEEIGVNLSNGFFINISFVNSELKKLPTEEKEKIAKEVGKITRNYFDESRISDGWLTFVIHKGFLVFSYTEAIDNYDLFEKKNDTIFASDKEEMSGSGEIIIDNQESFEITEQEQVNNCKEVYRVQIMASAKPIKDFKQKFPNLAVDELVLPENEPFRYKYTVGNECKIEDANKLLSKVRNLGYSKAFITKTANQ